MLDIYYTLLKEGSLPQKASPLSAGWDLRAAEEVHLAPGQIQAVPTGLALALPPHTEAQLRPRSGLSLRSSLSLPNSPGTIDADYRDEIKVLLYNRFSQSQLLEMLACGSPLCQRYGPIGESISLAEWLQNRQRGGEVEQLPEELLTRRLYLNQDGELWGTELLACGERIAQLIIKTVEDCRFISVKDVHSLGSDRGGGFGHSGQF